MREREGGSPRSVTSVRGGGHLPENERGRIKLKMELKKKKKKKGGKTVSVQLLQLSIFHGDFFSGWSLGRKSLSFRFENPPFILFQSRWCLFLQIVMIEELVGSYQL